MGGVSSSDEVSVFCASKDRIYMFTGQTTPGIPYFTMHLLVNRNIGSLFEQRATRYVTTILKTKPDKHIPPPPQFAMNRPNLASFEFFRSCIISIYPSPCTQKCFVAVSIFRIVSSGYKKKKKLTDKSYRLHIENPIEIEIKRRCRTKPMQSKNK